MLIPKPDLYVLNDVVSESPHREHLGLSDICEKCYRKLQYDHYWAYRKYHSARMNRLFNVGHSAEDVMISDLKKIGIEVSDQQKEIIATGGHWKGHIDGIYKNSNSESGLIEFKTHNDKSFADLKKKGVKESKPKHYDQMTAYMGYMLLDNAMYMALNKNNSEYYIEHVGFDPSHFADLKKKEAEVILSDTLLPRIGNNNKTWFECKMCDARGVCFGSIEVSKNCRTCQYVDVAHDGVWVCGVSNRALQAKEQRAGCREYEKSIMFKEL